jgi:hypothetical protein
VPKAGLTGVLRFCGTLTGECDNPSWNSDYKSDEKDGVAYNIADVESVLKHD